MLRKSRRQRVAAHLADRAGELDTRRAAADDDEREMSAACIGVGLALGGFERLEHATADLGRLRQRLEPGRIGFPFLVTEIGMLRAAGEQQIVVAKLAAVRDDLAAGGSTR